MYRRLDTPHLTDLYRSEHPDDAPAALCDLLSALAAEPWSARVWAVTSLGALRLTTAPRWQDEADHGSVSLSCAGRTVTASYVEPGGRVAARSTTVDVSRARWVAQTYVVWCLLGAS